MVATNNPLMLRYLIKTPKAPPKVCPDFRRFEGPKTALSLSRDRRFEAFGPENFIFSCACRAMSGYIWHRWWLISQSVELHTHAKSEDVLYHVGWEAFIPDASHNRELNSLAVKHWIELTKPAAKAKLATITIPGGKRTT